MSRFTEHQFDKLRHGNPDLAAPPEPEFRAPPPASYRRYAGEDLDNTVGHVSRVTCHVLRVTCHVCRVQLFVMFNVHLTMFSRLRSLLDRNALNIPRIPAFVALG